MAVIPFREHRPKLADGIFLAPDSWITGRVSLGAKCSVFFGAVLRGDIQPISVGSGVNIQEHAVLHTSTGLSDCTVGDFVTVGHRAILHGCTVSSRCIIGMGSTILDGAFIGEDSIVGAQSLVTMNKRFPARSLIMGSPAVAVRQLTDAEVESIRASADHYIEVGKTYLEYFLSA